MTAINFWENNRFEGARSRCRSGETDLYRWYGIVPVRVNGGDKIELVKKQLIIFFVVR